MRRFNFGSYLFNVPPEFNVPAACKMAVTAKPKVGSALMDENPKPVHPTPLLFFGINLNLTPLPHPDIPVSLSSGNGNVRVAHSLGMS